MDLAGFIFLHRKLLDSRVFQNEGLLKVWIWCLLKAGHEDRWVPVKTGRGETEILLRKGQFIFGRKTAAKELKMSPSTIRNRMEKLKKVENLDIQTDTHFSIVTIVNWELYQHPNKKEDTQTDRQRTGKGQPKDTNNNVDNVNKHKRAISVLEFFSPVINGWDKSKLEQTIDGFISTRKTGQISSGVIQKEIEYWKQYPNETINAALTAYVDGQYWKSGKGEKYFRGIIRGKDQAVQKESSQSLFQKAF